MIRCGAKGENNNKGHHHPWVFIRACSSAGSLCFNRVPIAHSGRAPSRAAMSADLGQCVGRAVAVVTCDGRVIVGLLEGFDQTMNVVLSACHERVFSRERPVAVAQLGTYLVRGENVYAPPLLTPLPTPCLTHRPTHRPVPSSAPSRRTLMPL